MAKFLTEPVPHEEGQRAIASKPAVTRAIFDQLAPDLQARTFLITGVEALDCVARVRELVAELPAGGDFRELKAQILAEMSPWLVDPAADEEERAKQEAAASRRAEMLLRLHGWQAYAGTQYKINEAHKDVFPYRQYLSSEDSRVRPHHAALNGKILPADHPFWLTHTAPWEHGCRCDCVVRTEDEVEEIRAAEAGKAPEDRLVLPPEQLRQIEQEKRIAKPGGQGFLDIRTPRERDGKGYEWRPADDSLSIDQILERFTPKERETFENFAGRQKLEDGRTLLAWWKRMPGGPADPAARKPAPGPAPAATSRTLATIRAELDALAGEQLMRQRDLNTAKAELTDATRRLYVRDPADDPSVIQAMVDAARVKMLAARDALDALEERGREAVSIPAADRGKVTITTKNGAKLAKHVKTGTDLTERYTAKRLLPSIGVVGLRGNRAFHRAGTIHVSTSTTASVIMHEITHATEQQRPEVLKASLDFLAKRSGGQATVSLRRHTGLNYQSHERAWEDEWESRGGNIYCGKDYDRRATELLTMGIERLHKGPVAFRREDPDYFDFILRTLQDL